MQLDPEALADVIVNAIAIAVGPLLEKNAASDVRIGELQGLFIKDVSRVEGYTAFIQRDLVAATERIAVLEARAPVPGPPGPQGPPGSDGLDGKDGTPGLRYCGVYVAGKTYDTGDLVTAGGSAWYCQRTTTTGPGDSRPDWTLMVKHGRDLRDPARRSA